MSLNAKKVKMASGGNKDIVEQEAIEAGTYPARVAQIIDLGLQPQRPYQGQEKPPVQEILITYELLDEFCLDEKGEEIEDKPRWVSETIPFHNLEVDLAKSTKRYKALDPEMEFDGDFTQLVTLPCMATITARAGSGKHVGKTFNNIGNVAQMRAKEAKKANELVNDSKVFVTSEPDLAIFNSLPDWMQDKIKDNLEFSGSALEVALSGGSAEKNLAKPDAKPDLKAEEEDDVKW